jgi:hypothetical protein
MVTITGVGSVTLQAAQAGNGSFNPANASQTFAVVPATATVTLGNLSQTYDGTAKSVTVTTAPSGLSTSVTYNGSATAPSAAGSYAIVATVTDPRYTGAAPGTLTVAIANQTISFTAIPGHTFGDAPFTVSATASSGLPVTFSVVSGPVTLSGNTVTIVGAGSVTLRAAQAGNVDFAAGNANQTFTVAQASATVTLGNLSQTFDGTAKSATVATNPAGLSTSVTYNGSAIVPSAASSYTVAATITNPNYSGSASGTLTITASNQTVTFTAIPGHTFGDAPFAVSATASSTLPVTFSVVSGPATVSGTMVTITGVGSVTLQAAQAGNGSFNPANASQTFTVVPATATVALSNVSQTYDGTAKSVTVTTNPSGLSNSITYNGSATAPSTVGSYAVAAIITDPRYTGSATGTLTIVAETQTLTFTPIPGHTFGDAPFAVSATASSNLPVTFSVTGGSATVSGGTLTITGVGSVTVQAAQAGNAVFAAATASQTFAVAQAAATVTLSNLSQTYDGSAKSVTVTTNPSGLSNSITYNGGATAPSAIGTYAVVATVTDPNYAGSASGTLAITAPPRPTITTQPINQTVSVGSGPTPNVVFIVAASGPGPITYQWQRKASGTSTWLNLSDGGAYSGTKTASLTITGATTAMDGDHFECVVTNGSGSVVSNAPTLTVVSGASATKPSFTTQPMPQMLNSGSTVVFLVDDPGGVSYQWQLNGVDLTDSPSGATSDVILGSASSELMITDATGASAGQYTVVATNSAGSTASNSAALQVQVSSDPGLATSISSRAFVGTGDNILIGGFYIVGSTSRTVLVQGLGPALTPLGVSGALQHPELSIHQIQTGHDVTLYSNTGWGSSQVLLNAAAAVFASPVLVSGSADSELLLTLPPGGYSAEVSGADGGTGVALCAIYELP